MKLSDLTALPVHPFADAFPMISDDELLSLAQDIEVNGLLDPLVTLDGQLLDGRNRLAALRKTNLSEVATVEYTGSDPLTFVLSKNLHRRHLTPIQWVEVGAKLRDPLAARGQGARTDLASADAMLPVGKTAAIVAEGLGSAVSERTLERGWKAMTDAPDLWEKAKQDGKGVNWAYEQMRKANPPGPAATAGDKVQSEPRPQYGIDTGADTSWRLPEREVSYAERRSTAIEILIRNATRVAESITQYAVTDGDLADSNEELSPEHARILADFFAGLA